MKEQNKILSMKNKLLLLLIAGFIALFAFGVRTYASDDVASPAGYFEYGGQQIPYYYLQRVERINYKKNGDTVSYQSSIPCYFAFLKSGGTNYFCVYSLDAFDGAWYYDTSGELFGSSPEKSTSIDGVDAYYSTSTCSYEIAYPWYTVSSISGFTNAFLTYMVSDEFEPFEPIEVPDFDSLESDYDFCLKGFSADNSILATWVGTVTDEYENEESFVVAYLGYAYKNQPAQIAVRELYNSKVLVSDNQFYIPWDEVQHDDDSLYLRYVEFVPYGRINPDKLFYPYIKGCSAYIYFSLDASGDIDSVKIPIKIDKDNLTTNILGGTFDSSIPALSDVQRVDNGFADPMSSYSQSSTIRWSTVFNDSDYYIQVRTTFRYKLNADKVWSEVTVDTSVPTGRYSCLVDAQSFTYTYGNYGPLFWQQDDSIWTADDLDSQGNLQPIRDSIRIVHVDNGVVSYGPWTTFTLKNGIWQTGEVTGSYESDYLEEDNTGGSIVEEDEVNSNFLTDFDFSDISGVWDAFIGIFKNLFSFLGQFPDLFSRIFSFLPYEIRSMIYVSMVAICVLGLVKAVVK